MFYDMRGWRHHLCRHIIGHHLCLDTPQLMTSPENVVVSLRKLEITLIGPWHGLENEVMSRDPKVTDTWNVQGTLKKADIAASKKLAFYLQPRSSYVFFFLGGGIPHPGAGEVWPDQGSTSLPFCLQHGWHISVWMREMRQIFTTELKSHTHYDKIASLKHITPNILF